MNSEQKRYRQISIFESFSSSKKLKSSDKSMDEKSELRNRMALAAEKRRQAMEEEYELKKDEQVAENSSQDLFDKAADMELGTSSSVPHDSADLFTGEEYSEEQQYVLETPPDTEENDINSEELFESVESYSNEKEELSEQCDSEEDEVEMSFLECLNRIPKCSLSLPKLEPLENHSIMFSPHIIPEKAPRPFPSSYQDKWSENYVRMPCSPQSKYSITNAYGEKLLQSRWGLICQSLSKDFETSDDLENAIRNYNSESVPLRWSFSGLHYYINMILLEEERDYLFDTLIPAMKKLALELPAICTQPIPLLKKSMDHYLTLSQKQIGCLLANAFFCTFPRRNLPGRRHKTRWTNEYASYPDINFNRLFIGTRRGITSVGAEKLKCIFNYFKQITTKEPCGTVTFHRQYLEETPRWQASDRGLKTAVIMSKGFIESEGEGMLQVDFANKYVGGGCLGQGCVQEEIRFLICPELIVSRLFVESLDPKEVLIVTGVEQYNKYSGYAETFKWRGNFQDQTPRDAWGRRYAELVAMDATNYYKISDQFQSSNMLRELNKAYCAFYQDARPENLSAVATGNWGCGVFKGNPSLKFVIQLMAASQAGRCLLYFTFGNKQLKKELNDIYTFLSDKNLCIGDIWRLLLKYGAKVEVQKKEINPTLYEFLLSAFSKVKEQKTENTGNVKVINNNEQNTENAENIQVSNHDDSSTDIEPT